MTTAVSSVLAMKPGSMMKHWRYSTAVACVVFGFHIVTSYAVQGLLTVGLWKQARFLRRSPQCRWRRDRLCCPRLGNIQLLMLWQGDCSLCHRFSCRAQVEGSGSSFVLALRFFRIKCYAAQASKFTKSQVEAPHM